MARKNPFQTEDRIDRAIECLSRMRTPDARALLAKEWKVTPSAVEKVFAEARRRMLELAQRTKDEARGDILATLDGIIYSPSTRDNDRIQACKVKARLLGVNAVVLPSPLDPLFDLEDQRRRIASVKQARHEHVFTVPAGRNDGEGIPVPDPHSTARNGVPSIDYGPDIQQSDR